MDTTKAILGEVDWEKVYKKLTVFACWLAREMPGVFDGISPEDLVGETLVAYFGSDNGLNYSPLQGSLDTFLCAVLKNKFLLHARRSHRCAGSLDDGQFRHELPRPAAGKGPTSGTITERLTTVAHGDTGLEELVTAAKTLEDNSKVNQQLSKKLVTPIRDVVNRKKRLRRRFGRADFSADSRTAANRNTTTVQGNGTKESE